MSNPNMPEAHLLGEGDWIAVTEICRLCAIEMPAVVEFVDLGLVVSRGIAPDEWLLPADSVPRLLMASRLMRDLGVNATGAALAIELLESRSALERRLRRLERLVHETG